MDQEKKVAHLRTRVMHRFVRTIAAIISLAFLPAAEVEARCLINGDYRDDISDADCLQAQRTGCVRSMLTETQYESCAKAVKDAKARGEVCLINGHARHDLSPYDCKEAKATGCVKRLLTSAQYAACLDAQR